MSLLRASTLLAALLLIAGCGRKPAPTAAKKPTPPKPTATLKAAKRKEPLSSNPEQVDNDGDFSLVNGNLHVCSPRNLGSYRNATIGKLGGVCPLDRNSENAAPEKSKKKGIPINLQVFRRRLFLSRNSTSKKMSPRRYPQRSPVAGCPFPHTKEQPCLRWKSCII